MSKVEKLRELNRRSYAALEVDFDATRFKPWQEIQPVVERMQSDCAVLDLGCGNARLLKAFPAVNFHYLGIDSNQYLLEKAREKYPEHSFQLCEMESVRLNANSFDFIFMIASFPHLATDEDRLELLVKCREALKENGILIISVWRLWQLRYLPYLFTRLDLKIDWNDFFIPWKKKEGTIWRYYHGFTERELRSLLARAGFQATLLHGSRHGQLVKRGYNIVVQANTL